MKKLLSLLFCVALALSANAQKTYAIITGVSNYEGDDHDLAQSFVPTADEAADPEKQASIYTTISLVRHLLSSLNSSAYDSIFILPVVYVQRILGAPCPLYENLD